MAPMMTSEISTCQGVVYLGMDVRPVAPPVMPLRLLMTEVTAWPKPKVIRAM